MRFSKNFKKNQKTFKKPLTLWLHYDIIDFAEGHKRICLGVAQLVARYLGVVEAASSSLVTQTKSESLKLSDFFVIF